MTRLLTALFAVALLATPARAGEEEAEQRFHEAYVQEVIEGHVAPAAKVYLALIRDPDTPPRLAAEAKFRFAVCAVLLGRPDEARGELAALVADEATPRSLAARAREYLKTIAGIGVGSELDKKLQQLVFDLARVSPAINAPVYREFEVIGKAALPFLRRLLEHDDVNLRRHAFRILARMGEPGLGQRWTPDIGLWGSFFKADVIGYMNEHSEELRALEQKLLALDDDQLSQHMGGFHRARFSFSLAFLDGVVAREAVRGYAFSYLGRAGVPQERWTRIGRWLASGDPHLAEPAAVWALKEWKSAPEDLQRALYSQVVRSGAAATDINWTQQLHGALREWSRVQPAGTLLDLIGEMVDRSRELSVDPKAIRTLPAIKGLPDDLANALDEKAPSDVDLKAYTALLRSWLSLDPVLRKQRTDDWVPTLVNRHTFEHLKFLLRELGRDEAEALCAWLFTGPLSVHEYDLIVNLMHAQTPRGVNLLRVAFETAPGRHGNLSQKLQSLPVTGPSYLEMARAVVDVTPASVRAVGVRRSLRLLSTYATHARRLPPEERKNQFAALLRVPRHLSEKSYSDFLTGILPGKPGESYTRRAHLDFLATTALDVYDELWGELSDVRRNEAVGTSLDFYTKTEDEPHAASQRKRIARFVRDHLDSVPGVKWPILWAHPGDFPHALWVPGAPPGFLNNARADAGIADRAAQEMTHDLTQVNRNVLDYIKWACSPKVRTELYDRILTQAPPGVRAEALYLLNFNSGEPASTGAIEAYLTWQLQRPKQEREPPAFWLASVGRAATILKTTRPSEQLFPAAHALLASGERTHVLQGISIARSLGRPDLLGDLAKLLDSMDAQVRTQAKDAMDSIRDLVLLRRQRVNPKSRGK